jgi:hypothetical protein
MAAPQMWPDFGPVGNVVLVALAALTAHLWDRRRWYRERLRDVVKLKLGRRAGSKRKRDGPGE